MYLCIILSRSRRLVKLYHIPDIIHNDTKRVMCIYVDQIIYYRKHYNS